MKVLIGSDHAGFELKNELKEYLSKTYQVEDFGAHEYKEGDDFPTILVPLALRVASSAEGDSMGIVIGGSGQGEAMVSNRFPGVRAAVYYGGNLDIVKLSREHNNSNILSLGARFISFDEAKEAVDLWLKTQFSNDEKYQRRNDMLDEIN